MIDIWVIDPGYIQQLHSIGCKWIPYMPIDSSPVTPGVLRPLPFADRIITFSKFGQNELKRQGWVSDMIYEGVDVNLLKPKDKIEARKKLGLPQDVFIWGMIAANKENPPRKSFQEAIEAFKVFSDAHPEARLFIHTQQIAPGNFPIKEYVQYLGMGDKVFYLDQMLASFFATREDIEIQYNAMDALLSPSQTEGFGLCIIEAQACGKPVVVNNCHSMPELIIPGKTGEMAEVYTRRWTNALSFWEVPAPETIWVAMEKVYKMLKENPHQVADNCRRNVVKNFNVDVIFKDKWLPYFENLQNQLLPLSLKIAKI